MRSPADIKATGAAWVTETELAYLCERLEELETVTGDGSGVALPPIESAPVEIPRISPPFGMAASSKRDDAGADDRAYPERLARADVAILREAGLCELADIAERYVVAQERPWWRKFFGL